MRVTKAGLGALVVVGLVSAISAQSRGRAGLGVPAAAAPRTVAAPPASVSPARAQVADAFEQYCVDCHGKGRPKGGVSIARLIERMTPEGLGEQWEHWQSIAGMLETRQMPPEDADAFPSDAQRAQAVDWIRATFATYDAAHAGEPGRVTVRRLTSAEYAYAIRDLTGVDVKVGVDASSDAVGGEGFANFGDVQFVQDASVERYLEAARQVAEHAVLGSGPLGFYADPGDTGLELSALNRIEELYASRGFRVVSGEGGRPFGVDRYAKAFYVAWRYRHRAALGEPATTLRALATREGITGRFAEHVYGVVTGATRSYPLSATIERWQALPRPGNDPAGTAAAVRTECDAITKSLISWPSWFFARGDLAAGGQGDENPLVFDDTTLGVEPRHAYRHSLNRRFGRPASRLPAPWTVHLAVDALHAGAGAPPVVIWRNPRIVLRTPPPPPQPNEPAAVARLRVPGPIVSTHPLREVLPADVVARLRFGTSPDGTAIGPDDFATTQATSLVVDVAAGEHVAELHVDAELGANRDAVVRVMVSDSATAVARAPGQRVFLGDPASAGYRTFRDGIAEYVASLPPNSHGAANPADKDPVPPPFDNTYNSPEHDAFVTSVKYQRTDDFFTNHIVEGEERARLEHAWNDLLGSWPYHDAYLRMLIEHFGGLGQPAATVAPTLGQPAASIANVDHRFGGLGQPAATDVPPGQPAAPDAVGGAPRSQRAETAKIADMTPARIAALPEAARVHVRALRAHYDHVQRAMTQAEPGHVTDAIAFAARAWRRPLTPAERSSLRTFYTASRRERGLDHRAAVRALIARILMSPAFLYRLEASPVQTERRLDDWEIASRLSFFLWSSIPDEDLRRAAAAGQLRRPAALKAQVRRMVADPKARRLATEFFGQWLGFYHFDEYRGVDTGRFPEFTDAVRASMYDEAISTFEYIVREGRPVREILHADYAFLDKTLARFYGIEAKVTSTGPVERIDGARAFDRGGALRLGAVLTTTSAPLRTSPVKRGDWILRRILGTPTPPPPADAGTLPADDKSFEGQTLRERLAQHKGKPQCASCHLRIDPLGFPLESFDAVGRVRTTYADGKPVDDIGEFRDKSTIVGAGGLLAYLESKDAAVMTTLSRKMLGYALGRNPQASDRRLLAEMVAAGGDASFADLAVTLVTSRQFRNHSGRTRVASPMTPSPAHAPAAASAPTRADTP